MGHSDNGYCGCGECERDFLLSHPPIEEEYDSGSFDEDVSAFDSSEWDWEMFFLSGHDFFAIDAS